MTLAPTFALRSALATTAGERHIVTASERLSGAASEHWSVADSGRPAVAVSDSGWGPIPVTHATSRMRPIFGLCPRTIEVNLTLTLTLTDWHSLMYYIDTVFLLHYSRFKEVALNVAITEMQKMALDLKKVSVVHLVPDKDYIPVSFLSNACLKMEEIADIIDNTSPSSRKP
jgi:hypothetical protein